VEQKQLFFVCGGVFADGNLDRLETDAKPECYGPFTELETAESVCAAHRRRNVDICWHHLYVVSTATPG
jgi:hypothetical protein